MKFRFEQLAAQEAIDYLKEKFGGVFMISGERGRIEPQQAVSNDNHTRGYELLSPSWVGYRGEYVIEFLSRYFTRNQKVCKKIQDWASKFQMPEIRAGYVGNAKLETNFVDQQFETGLNA